MRFDKTGPMMLISECGCYLVMKVIDQVAGKVRFEAWAETLLGQFESGESAREACTKDYAEQRVTEFYF